MLGKSNITNQGNYIMKILPVSTYQPFKTNNNVHKNSILPQVHFTSKPVLTPEQITENADLRVFHHHIYEYKKGIRNLILTTEKAKYKEPIENRLKHEKIDYVIHDIEKDKINVYFGEKPCVDVVKTFSPKLNKLTPEQDFILGIMLGYDRLKQCVRYLDFRKRAAK